MSPSVADLLRDRDDVTDVVELRETGAQVDGHDSLVAAMNAEGLDRVIDLGIEEGSLDSFEAGTILVSTGRADASLSDGRRVTVTFAETGPTTMRITATFSRGALINASYVVGLPDFAANVTSPLDAAILVNHAPGVDPEQGKANIEAALADYPNVTVNSPDDITENAQNSVNQLLGIVTSVAPPRRCRRRARHREHTGPLGRRADARARAAARRRRHARQVRTVVRRESVLMSMLGAFTGVALGTLSGVALSRAFVNEGITTIAIPTLSLAIYLLLAAGVGVLAAIGPARRASRVDFLRAIASE